MKNVCVKDILEGSRIEGSFLVTKKETGVSKTGKPYITLKLRDSSGEVDARIWDDCESVGEGFAKNDVITVKGGAIRYQGKIQLNVTEAKKNEGSFDIRDYLPASVRKPDEMLSELMGVISGVRDRHIKSLLESIFGDSEIRARFMLAPAAKAMHHPYLGGLLEHVTSILRLGKFVSSHYKGVNEDLLIAGLILHDLGKIYEISYERAFDYTDEGRLLGHITMGVELIEDKIKEIEDFPATLSTLLKHIILSHHGHLEFGSPKRPKTLEATIVYYLDDLDAKINAIQSLMEKEGGAGNWSDYQRMFERYIYRVPYAGEDAAKAQGGAEGASGDDEDFRLFK